jgi:hypothetical protein
MKYSIPFENKSIAKTPPIAIGKNTPATNVIARHAKSNTSRLLFETDSLKSDRSVPTIAPAPQKAQSFGNVQTKIQEEIFFEIFTKMCHESQHSFVNPKNRRQNTT